jgi:diguanylate cyclase (GGDEF)-like protein
MADFFKENLDYIFFFYGLAFIILAAVCISLQKTERERLPWGLLSLFGFTHGMTEWADLTALAIGDSPLFQAARCLLMTISFLFLMEFGRAGGVRLRGKGPGRRILLLPLAFAAAGGLAAGWTGINVAARYALGFSGGIWAALTLYRYAEEKAKQTRHLLIAAILTGLYAAATGLVVPTLPFFPASAVNMDNFFRFVGLPIQLIRAFIAIGIAAAVYFYSDISREESADRRYFNRHFRTIRRTFTLVVILILVAGWVLTHYLGGSAHRIVVDEGNRYIAALADHLTANLKEPERAVNALALSPWILPALVTGRPGDIGRANLILDQYLDARDFSVCYLMDLQGITIASSNRYSPESFVGRSYAFRNYFRQAVSGTPAIQFAVGVTTSERGYYASSPVLTPDGRIVGAAVVKQNLDKSEAKFIGGHGDTFFVSPEGIVFLSSRQENRLQSLWPMEEKAKEKFISHHDFGPGPFPSLLQRQPLDGETISFNGLLCLVSRQFLNQEGWSLVMLQPADRISFYRLMAILITLTLCLLAIFLYVGFQKSLDATAQVVLFESRFRAVFESAPGAIFIVDGETHRILSFNTFLKNWLGYQEEELQGMTLEDLQGTDNGDGGYQYRKKDGGFVHVEEIRKPVPFSGRDSILIIVHDISEHKRLEELLQALSRRDGLTGLANRRHFDECLDREWKRALREKAPLSIIMCDIDFFKNYNDTYGHQKGDDCLRAVAGVFERDLHRPLDVAARYGGEEFILVLPGTPLPGALAVAESIRSGIEALAIPHASSSVGPVVTISLGVASVVPSPDVSASEIVSAADQALYRAKNGGRNRVST